MTKHVLPSESAAAATSPVGRSVGILVGGQATAHLLTLAAAPVLTRLYAPQDFGAAAVFAALLAFFAVVANLRYELSIALPASGADAENLAALCLLCTGLTTALSALMVFAFGAPLVGLLNWGLDAAYLLLLPFAIMAAGLYGMIEKWMVRTHSFGQLAQTRLLQSAIGNLVQLTGSGFGVLALMGGSAIGQGMGGLRYAIRELRRRGTANLAWHRIAAMAIRYKNFPLYSTWTALFNVAGLQLVPLVFSALYGTAVVGFFAFALRMVSAPTALIGGALGNVFLAHAPTARRNGELTALAENMRRKLAMAGIPALVLLLFAGPDIFAAVFGERWRQAGQYASWMAPWIYLQFQFSPVSHLADVLEMQRLELSAQFATFVLRFGVLGACYGLGAHADQSVAAFAAASAVAYFGMLVLFMSRVGVGVPAMLAHDLGRIAVFLLCALPAILLFDASADWRSAAAVFYFLALSALWLHRGLRAPRSGPIPA
ncbi:O-antigen translocase [Cupriavidus oxalaticus]|uniref:lipopolysaccharide biosynthesis protein n=1 Tax=Cupriavidus oxalaticus TaxID=96344 RepID=UPI003F73B42A